MRLTFTQVFFAAILLFYCCSSNDNFVDPDSITYPFTIEEFSKLNARDQMTVIIYNQKDKVKRFLSEQPFALQYEKKPCRTDKKNKECQIDYHFRLLADQTGETTGIVRYNPTTHTCKWIGQSHKTLALRGTPK